MKRIFQLLILIFALTSCNLILNKETKFADDFLIAFRDGNYDALNNMLYKSENPQNNLVFLLTRQQLLPAKIQNMKWSFEEVEDVVENDVTFKFVHFKLNGVDTKIGLVFSEADNAYKVVSPNFFGDAMHTFSSK